MDYAIFEISYYKVIEVTTRKKMSFFLDKILKVLKRFEYLSLVYMFYHAQFHHLQKLFYIEPSDRVSGVVEVDSC
jgi:hypothetical protein